MLITGYPGIGKTTFGMQVAHQLLKNNPTSSIHFIDLRCIDSVQTIIQTFLQCFWEALHDKPTEQLAFSFTRLKEQWSCFSTTVKMLSLKSSRCHFLIL